MVSKVRTIDFLPDIFQTKTNEQFLSASLDQLTQQPNYRRMQGYIGAKFGYGVTNGDAYIQEPSRTRSNYQLEPGVIFNKTDTQLPYDALTYPGLLESLSLQGSSVDNNNTLFNNEFYSWDSFCDLDKIINFSQYYWLPNGPDAVTLTPENFLLKAAYGVISGANTYKFSQNEVKNDTENPVLTLVRGGTYTFNIDQKTPFWIQTMPGVSGTTPGTSGVSTRNVFGLDNNGMTKGVITFKVPLTNAQDDYIFPQGISVDIATTTKWENIYGKKLKQLQNIDGISDLNGKTILFYGNDSYASGFMGGFYDLVGYDTENYEFGRYTNLNTWSFKIVLTGDVSDPIVTLVEDTMLPIDQNIYIRTGNTYGTRKFVRNSIGDIVLLPYLTATLDTLYYQDGVNKDKVGVIKLVNSSAQILDVNDILGSKSYQSPNGIQLSNGLKVQFVGNIIPESYKYGQYYVEGVGSDIKLLPTPDFLVTEPFTAIIQTPYDIDPYDTTNYGEALYVIQDPDYITINRSSIDKNAWSRSNRWFHKDVIQLSIDNNSMSPLSSYAFENNTRAKRPIIEFYPNLKLFNSGSISKGPIDYINFTATDAFTECNGQTSFAPDGPASLLFDGCRIVFAGDVNLNIRNKIYIVSFITTDTNPTPIISLTEAPDGLVEIQDQVQVTKGETHIGHTYWFNGYSWIDCQFKETINQPPRFDIFNNKGVSYGDKDFYNSSDFDGCTLFEYAPTTGVDDIVLGFPIKYSSVSNLGDITFNISLNNQTFNYVDNSISKVGNINEGYVYEYNSRLEYTRKIGWQTAVENSFQYQVFNFVSTGDNFTLDCDIAALTDSETEWKPIVVYVDNTRQDPSAYTVTIGTNKTSITLLDTTIAIGTSIDIMLYSNQVSKTAYYQIPSNLVNNPFNAEMNTVNFGDIRGHYKSICNNVDTLVGTAFGSNNYRDLGNLIPYGTRLIQNSASLAIPAIFLRNKDTNILNALEYNANEYIKFKTLLIDTVNRIDFNPLQDDASILDTALSEITSAKSESNPFFWSDMTPCKDPTITNTYSFNIGVSTSEFPLSRVYDFDNANYYSVLVYLVRKINGRSRTIQLVRNIDYTISSDVAKVVVSTDLIQNDIIVVKEYHQTYGNFVPNTPTKVGLYPKFLPEVVYDTTYINPTYFIKGHDGSYSKLYGDFVDGYLQDFRDRALFEFEMRIYNNIKVSAKIPVEYDDIFPGAFRTTEYTSDQLTQLYNTNFLNWIGLNRVDYKTQTFISSNEYTWNYKNSTDRTNNVIKQGNWRGIYLWYYDTATPNFTPWEMLGLSTKPTWWETRYGEAPYTSDNTLLWQDLSDGYIYNDGNSYVNEKRKRPNLMSIIPVDEVGNLKSPFGNIVFGYDFDKFKNEWEAEDVGPVEYSYLKSSSWPFDLMRIIAMTKPAKFFSMGINLDMYKYNTEFNQYLVNNRTRSLLHLDSLYFYGTDSSTSSNSYINWVVDYLLQFGISGSSIIRDFFLNVDVRLTYRLAGFSDKDMLKFFIEKGSVDNLTTSLLIPDESYNILMYENEPSEMVVYSSVIVQKTNTGFKVYGNSQTRAYFTALLPQQNGNLNAVTVNNLTVRLYKDYTENEIIVPYGTEFRTITDLSNFLIGYGKFLNKQGVLFNDIENGIELTWNQMVAETMYWYQSGWEVGSTVNVNPSANKVSIDKENLVVQPLTIQKQNYILNQNLIPIQLKDMSVYRKDTLFSAKALNPGDSISYLNARMSNIEHLIVFNNTTSFNDLIYNPVTALRQQRLYVKGSKTAEWNGTMNAAGFIINENNVQEWVPNQKYTKGIIVKYKNKYWMSQDIIPPTPTFDTTKWIVTDYDKIRTGLLPNASNRAFESTMYYDSYRTNLESDGDLLGFSLIGYRPRQYMVDSDLDDITQVNVYKNMLGAKGTSTASTGLNNLTVNQNTIDYKIHENWAVKTSEFGGILNQNFVEFTLDQTSLVGNPSTASLIINSVVENSEQQVPLYQLKNYGRQITSPDILSVVDSFEAKLPNAGYVNLDDVRAAGYTISSLDDAIIGDIYKGDYIWIADNLNTWNVYSLYSMNNTLTQVFNNLNGTATFTFSKAHNLTKYDSIGVLNFSTDIDGFYKIEDVKDSLNVIVTLALPSSTSAIVGQGLPYKLQYQRVGTARDIELLPLLDNDFSANKVWVDKNVDGDWTVYERKSRYTNSNFEKDTLGTEYGTGMCYIDKIGYFITDPSQNKMYQYRKFSGNFHLFKTYEPLGTSTTRYGTTLTHSDKFIIVSDSNPNAYGSGGSSYFFVYKITYDKNLPILTLEQVEEVTDSRFCDAMALSGDSNYLYTNALDYGLVIPYQLDKDFVYTNIGLTLAQATVVDEKKFVVTGGDKTNSIDEGKYVAFNNAGNEVVYTYITSKWTPDPSDPTNHTKGYTTFYTIEPMKYSYPSGTTVYTASYHFSLIMVYVNVGDPTVPDLLTQPNAVEDKFGYSLATNYDGTKLFIGAPMTNWDINHQDIGKTYVYDRLVTNYEAQRNGINGGTFIAVTQYLIDPGARVYLNGKLLVSGQYLIAVNRVGILGELVKAGDIITVSTGRFVVMEELFSYETTSDIIPGEQYGFSLSSNKDASELLVGSPYNLHVGDSQGAVYRHTNGDKRFGYKVGVLAANLTEPTYFYLNGYVVNAFRSVEFLSTVSLGSTSVTLKVADAAKLPSYGILSFYKTDTGNIRSVAYNNVNTTTGEVTFSAPFSYAITFTSPISYVNVPLGNSVNIANAINDSNITNVFAYSTSDMRLVIRLRDVNLNPVNNKLNLTVLNGNDLFEMGFQSTYTKSQIISSPYPQRASLFGYAVKYNQYNSFLVSAPTDTRHTYTTFDFTDDNNYHNDTVFDNGFTRWMDTTPSAGAVYMYDYINTYDEALDENKIGKYFFAQNINDTVTTNDTLPMYGTSLAFDGYVAMVGDPGYDTNFTTSRVVIYENTEYKQNWSPLREYVPVVDINKIQRVQMYNNLTNENIASLDYFDPLNGKLLGAVGENLDFISGNDPAGYNNPTITKGNVKWGREHEGTLWFDTSTVRFINYHQNDIKYDSQYWGAVFPGSIVSVYSWIESEVPPNLYTGNGTVYDTEKYSVSFDTDANSVVVPKYYYWVKNTNIVYSYKNKTLSDSIIQSYISNPQSSGISYFAPLSQNTFAFYNSAEYIRGKTTNIHIGFSSSNSDSSKHEEFRLIRTDYPSDFLPGIPSVTTNTLTPESLYDRFLDSLSGTDEGGAVVPDPNLPKLLQTGINARPRQSLFVNRFNALTNYFDFVNTTIAKYPVTEMGNATFLAANGEFYNVMSYWSFIYWWADGYANTTRTSFEVSVYADLETLPATEGLIVGVAKNGQGKREVYIYQSSTWVRIGLQDGTIKFSDKLWDYYTNKIGFGDNYFDSVPYDEYPSVETRYILRAINEQIFTGELFKYRNQGLILMFEYIQSENIESQNYMPWLSKTSFIDVDYLVRQLVPYDRYRDDNQELLNGYINEIKPYHVVIKEFTMRYTGTDEYTAGYTDFDLPASYNTYIDRFVSPQLVYKNSDNQTTFDPTSTIWDNSNYTSWFNHYGVGLVGTPNVIVCTVTRYFGPADTTIFVDNARGMPIQGQVTIGDEIIGYYGIDRDRSILYGVSRGLYNTTPVAHTYGEVMRMDVPGVIVLSSGTRYTSPPTIRAYVDTSKYPAPRTPAILKPIMGDNDVIGVTIVDPGDGYVVPPEIIIENSYQITFRINQINFDYRTITLNSAEFNEGDLVKIESSGTSSVFANKFYYIHIVDPYNFIISLHGSEMDALSDTHREMFLSGNINTSDVYTIGISALAIPNMSGNKVRSVLDVIRFDRTSYQAKVVEWTPGQFWSSPYQSLGNDASSGELLYDSIPYTINVGSGDVTPSGGTGAKFTVYNVVTGEEYQADIIDGGQNYNVGDVITILGSKLGGTNVTNDCTITVVTTGTSNSITDFTILGTPANVVSASLQGAIMPITSVDPEPVRNSTLVTLNLATTGIKIGQLKGMKVYFYNSPTTYTYDDSGSGGAIIEIGQPRFNPSSVTRQYTIKVIDSGNIYTDGDVIVVPGNLLGGNPGTNDAIITIDYTTPGGGIYICRIDGTAPVVFGEYYVSPYEVLSSTVGVVEVFVNPGLMTALPYDVSFNYQYAYIPEPLLSGLAYRFEVSSLVTYQNKIWRCIESNNDTTFNLSKWELIPDYDRNINALDRIAAYYQPTVGMLGKNNSQLLSGVSYPNTVYKGNFFATQDQLPIDIELMDLPFSYRKLSIKDMLYDGTQYLGVADGPEGTIIVSSSDLGVTWNFNTVSTTALGVTSLSYDSDHYLITTTNLNNSIMLSYDGLKYISIGDYTPYDSVPFDISVYDTGALTTPTKFMNDSTIVNGMSIIVGDNNISMSENFAIWDQQYSVNSSLVNVMNCVRYIQVTHFDGFLVVGRSDTIVSGAGTAAPNIQSYSLIATSLDGVNWNLQQPKLANSILYAIANSASLIVIGGEHADIWYSTNGNNWIKASYTVTPSSETITGIAYHNSKFVAVGTNGFVAVSSDGMTFTEVSGVTTNDFNNIFVDSSSNRFVAIGTNDTILRSANGITWVDISYTQEKLSEYEIVGDDFTFGYGPEELVAGLISDNLSMTVTTAPGSYWDLDTFTQNFWYYNTGFNMVANLLTPDNNNTVSFANVIHNPATISVYVMDTTTNESHRIYTMNSVNNPISYTVNWIDQTITLNQSLSTGKKLLVEVYSIGNGRQYTNGNTLHYPLMIEPSSGNSMIEFNITWAPLTTDPVVYVNGEKLVYTVDYDVIFTSEGNIKIQFNNVYDDTVDYISFAILKTSVTDYNPTEYGYSAVDTELFAGNGTDYVTSLSLSGSNDVNLIVEVNGVRLIPTTDYTVNTGTNTISLSTGVTSDDIVAITAYNETGRLWASTVTNSSLTVSQITSVYNLATAMISVSFASVGSVISTGSKVRIDGVVGSTGLNGNTYYVKQVTKPETTTTYIFYELYSDSGLTSPVNGYAIGAYDTSGYIWLESQTISIPSPSVPYPMPDIVYTQGNKTFTTVNGLRINPENVIFREDNKISICVPIATSSKVVVTAFGDGYTPEENTFKLIVNKNNIPSVYRTNRNDGTWITTPMNDETDYIKVRNAATIVKEVVEHPIATTGNGIVFAYISTTTNIRMVKDFKVYNNTTLTDVDGSLKLVDGKPAIVFDSGVSVGDNLTVSLYLGEYVIIGTELIYFTAVDLDTNTITGLVRGVNGTTISSHSEFDMVYAINQYVKLENVYNGLLWNSFNYPNNSDPLQISTTESAKFLRK